MTENLSEYLNYVYSVANKIFESSNQSWTDIGEKWPNYFNLDSVLANSEDKINLFLKLVCIENTLPVQMITLILLLQYSTNLDKDYINHLLLFYEYSDNDLYFNTRNSNYFENIIKLNESIPLENLAWLLKKEFIVPSVSYCYYFKNRMMCMSEEKKLKFVEYVEPFVFPKHKKRLRDIIIHNIEYTSNKNVLYNTPGKYILSDTLIGYKVLHIADKFETCIAKVSLPRNTIVIYPEQKGNANKLRCNRYKMENIVKRDGTNIIMAKAPVYHKIYRVNQIYIDENLDLDITKECGTGLHFYQTFDDAVSSEFMILK